MRQIVLRASHIARRRRAKLFRSLFDLTVHTTVLDLGSEQGNAIADVLTGTPVKPENVWIADLSKADVSAGAARYGFHPVWLREGETLPFPDFSFDIVYCSSVIEHVTVPKSEVWNIRSESVFREMAFAAQLQFATEIGRVGRHFFVQTPNRKFFVESHTWLPFVGWLPRSLMLEVIRFSNYFWIKKTKPDFNLLDHNSLSQLFPGSKIYYELLMGLKKSLIAVRN